MFKTEIEDWLLPDVCEALNEYVEDYASRLVLAGLLWFAPEQQSATVIADSIELPRSAVFASLAWLEEHDLAVSIERPASPASGHKTWQAWKTAALDWPDLRFRLAALTSSARNAFVAVEPLMLTHNPDAAEERK